MATTSYQFICFENATIWPSTPSWVAWSPRDFVSAPMMEMDTIYRAILIIRFAGWKRGMTIQISPAPNRRHSKMCRDFWKKLPICIFGCPKLYLGWKKFKKFFLKGAQPNVPDPPYFQYFFPNLAYWESCQSSATYNLWLKAESWSLNFKISNF